MNKIHKNQKHGYAISKPPTYNAWINMRARCNDKNRPDYYRYGGRGIKVCDRWNSFENFLEDMGERPENLTLDRIDSDGDYRPDNCRWATRKRQSRNREYAKKITYKGQTKAVGDWADEIGMPRRNLYKRIFTRGWSIERAIEQPYKPLK